MAKIPLKQDLSCSGQKLSSFSVPTLAHWLTPCSVTEAFRYHDNNTTTINNNNSRAKCPIRVNGEDVEKNPECYFEDLSTHVITTLLFSLSFDINQLREKLLEVFVQLRQTMLKLQELQSSLVLPNLPTHCNIFQALYLNTATKRSNIPMDDFRET